jgi:hypothetical protein
MAKYVIYKGSKEIIVCTAKDESKMLKEFFENGGRDVDGYYRQKKKNCGIGIGISSNPYTF